MPKVTVAMPLYNDELYIAEAVCSILDQTLADLELLVINDGSTDRSAEIVGNFSDRRIRLVDNGANLGRAQSRNRALDLANGEFLAWMDADDISDPERLALQVAFLEQAPDLVVCSTPMELFQNKTGVIGQILTADEIIAQTVFSPVAFNGPSCLRLDSIRDLGIRFDPKLKRAEDFGFMADLFVGKRARAGILPKALYKCRYFERPTTREFHAQAVREHVFPALGIEPDAGLADLHTDIILDYPHMVIRKHGFASLLAWLDRIYRHGQCLGSSIQACLLEFICELLGHLVGPEYREQLFRLWPRTLMGKAIARPALARRLARGR